ncbi:hypothetical protein, partial [uncultured Phocaeicola sp.]|uniref:hypothetical protein n=1 Tax=uncultured Phocaeicola sp. TaxID=990718 RepID=UPI0025A9F592
ACPRRVTCVQRVQGPERLPERKKVVTAGEPGTAGKASTVGAAAWQEKGERHRNVTARIPQAFCTVKSHSSIGRFLHAAQAQLKTPY